jgi:hypothetical protein
MGQLPDFLNRFNFLAIRVPPPLRDSSPRPPVFFRLQGVFGPIGETVLRPPLPCLRVV